jgi:hypothetical protein
VKRFDPQGEEWQRAMVDLDEMLARRRRLLGATGQDGSPDPEPEPEPEQ